MAAVAESSLELGELRVIRTSHKIAQANMVESSRLHKPVLEAVRCCVANSVTAMGKQGILTGE